MTNNTKKIALSGVMSAIAVLCLLFATIMPTGKLSFYVLSSFFVSVIIIEYGTKPGWVFYIITNLLAYILIPDKIRIIPYTVFFGAYGILKYYIEKFNNIVLEYILKYIYFNACLAIALIFLREIIAKGITLNKIKFPLWTVIILLEVIFIIYDYVYTLFIQYYRQKLKRFL
ncbi:MAG TPA: hypothetical protein GX527_06190 [Clostridiaceae bacterium]|jgi:hypothetical protein|nr:hypothetical protein [Clostridiaceae bacterium]